MREKKFRAWLPGINKMTYAHTLDELVTWKVSPETKGTAVWLQFTGLKSKSGVEIYEGDRVIISIDHQVYSDQRQVLFEGVIEYRGKDVSSLGCGFGVSHDGQFDFLSTLSNRCEIEVIGNIYDSEVP